MRQGRVREIIEATDACIARALEYIDTHNAPAEELAAIARLHEAQAAGPVGAVVLALAEVGQLQRCPAGFWREVERAAALALPLYSPVIGSVERARREQFHARLQQLQCNPDAEPAAAPDAAGDYSFLEVPGLAAPPLLSYFLRRRRTCCDAHGST